MKLRCSSLVMVLLFVFSLLTVQTALPASDDNIDWSKATPAERHQKMWEAKARTLADRQYSQQLAAQAPLVNTQTNYDVKFYDIYIRVNDTTNVLYGAVRMVAASTQPGVNAVQVDFFDNMAVDSIVAPSGQLSYTRASNVVTVNLGLSYNQGDQFDFRFYYHGTPTQGGFQAFAFGTHNGKKIISSLSEPYFSRTWWPCKDRNDDKADSFNIAIETDTSFYCGSNGTLDSIVQHTANTHIFYYRMRHPMANYLFSVAIYPYIVWTDWYHYNVGKDSMRITNAVYPDMYSYSLSTWGVTPGAIAIFSQNYGPYPYLDEKYGHSNFQWGGGMEHQTMTSMTGTSFGFSEPVVVHELSHQWWGDMITCKTWGDIWLNEGFASYSEALYYLNKSGWDSYHNYMAGMDFSGGGTIFITDTTNVGIIFGSIVYDKGAWVLHMLRRIIGETKFAAMWNAWYHSPFQYGSATTTDFQNVVDSVSGQNLNWFFNEWIYGTYRPNYSWSWASYPNPSGGYDTYVEVKQTQTTSPQTFIMPIDFFYATNSTTDTVSLMVNSRRKVVSWHSADQVQGIVFDPSNWVLKYQSSQPWGLTIVTDSVLAAGKQYTNYKDTIRTLGNTGAMNYSLIGGTLPPGLTINNSGVFLGAPTDTGTFAFRLRVLDNSSAQADTANFTLAVGPAVLYPGDVNFSQSPNIDLGDLSALVSYLTTGQPIPPVKKLADINADCVIDLGDLSRMVAYLTSPGVTLLMGCAQ